MSGTDGNRVEAPSSHGRGWMIAGIAAIAVAMVAAGIGVGAAIWAGDDSDGGSSTSDTDPPARARAEDVLVGFPKIKNIDEYLSQGAPFPCENGDGHNQGASDSGKGQCITMSFDVLAAYDWFPSDLPGTVFGQGTCPLKFPYPEEGALSSNPIYADSSGPGTRVTVKAVSSETGKYDFINEPLSYAGSADLGQQGYVILAGNRGFGYDPDTARMKGSFNCSSVPADPI